MARHEITVDMLTEAHQATGIVRAVPDLSTPFVRGQERPQAREEGGDQQLLWDVEAMRVVDVYGEQRTEVYQVRVPAPQKPVLAPGPTKFRDLSIVVQVRVERAGRQITSVTETEYWSARGVESASRQQPSVQQPQQAKVAS